MLIISIEKKWFQFFALGTKSTNIDTFCTKRNNNAIKIFCLCYVS